MPSRTNCFLALTALVTASALPGCWETVPVSRGYPYHERFVGATPRNVVEVIHSADDPGWNHGPDYTRTAPHGTVTTHTPYYPPPKAAVVKKPVAKPAAKPPVVIVKKKPVGC